MKIFRFILIVIGIFIFLLFAIPFFLPNRAYSEREIVINQPIDSVYYYLLDLNNFKDWNPWTDMEKELVLSVTNNNLDIGSKIEWEGDSLGSGYLERIELIPNKLIKSKIIFIKPWKSEANDMMNFEKINEKSTKVRWGMQMQLDYP
ncbi:MAG: hypothetical protein N3A67_09640, partial [Ignavibacteria bacterium]|nr:hypothetical protein [Ignavibacteria bacterium]